MMRRFWLFPKISASLSDTKDTLTVFVAFLVILHPKRTVNVSIIIPAFPPLWRMVFPDVDF